MIDTAIAVEGLSKVYMLSHSTAAAGGYVSLRDVIARNAKTFARQTRDLLRGSAVVPGDVLEEFSALKDVNFEIKQGERIGIIGRNGAGKSTLLKILSRITEPTAGRVRITGQVASLLEVGTGFHPELTGRENILLNGAILGMSRAEIRRKMDAIIEFAEVEKFLDTPVKRYSSGMYVRLAFSVAAHLEPDILVVDEVLAVGDARFQKKCMGQMQQVGREGRTVLFVSHNMGAVAELCDRAILLSEGRVVMDGSVADAVSQYLHVDGPIGARSFKRRNKHPIYVTHLRLTDEQGAALSQTVLGQDAILEFDFVIEEPLANVNFAVLVSRSGTPLLYTHDNDTDPSLYDAVRGSGSYTARIPLPLSKFKEGNYSVEVHLGAGATNMTERDTLLSFVIENYEINTQNKGYRADRPGQLYWPIAWNIRRG